MSQANKDMVRNLRANALRDLSVLVQQLGRSTKGLGYSLCLSELILAPVVPSNTARGGGILAPIMRSLAVSLDSRPDRRLSALP